MAPQIFLGGAAGLTTWRAEVAIPALESARVSYFNPQLPLHAWTTEREAEEMQAKDAAQVLLFVISHETRGVATVAEVAYYMGLGRPLALVINDIPHGAVLYGQPLSQPEIDDLNRGRIFLRTMARVHNVPVFDSISDAVQYAIQLAQPAQSLATIQAILHDISFGECSFRIEPIANDFLLQIYTPEFTGRKWFIERTASRADVVRTALKAALTWQEHEGREFFTYRGKRIHGPHFEI